MVKDQNAKNWGRFEERRQKMLEGCKERIKAGVESEGTPPNAVAETIEKALFEEKPRERYLVVPKQIEAGWTIAKATDELLKLNIGHEYSYTQDELVQLIDAMWPYLTGEKSNDIPEDDEAMQKFMQAWMNK